MPRIPLYNQGAPTAVKLEAGQLSRRADVGAFTAPGRAAAGLAKTVGDIAFQFGQAEKQLQTDRTATEYENLSRQEADDYRIGLTETDTATAAEGLKKIEDKYINKIAGLNLTRSQKQAVEKRVRQKFAPQYTNVKQAAFANHIRVTSAAENESLKSLATEMAFAWADKEMTFDEFGDETELHTALYEQGIKKIQDGMTKGLSINYTPSSFRAEFLKQVIAGVTADPTGSSISLIDRAREELNKAKGDEFTVAETAKAINDLAVAKDLAIATKVETISGQVFEAGLSEDEFDSVISQLRNPDNLSALVEREDTKFTFDISEIPSDIRATVANSLRIKRDIASSEEQKELLESATLGLQGKSLSYLQSAKQEAQSGTGIAKNMDRSTRIAFESSIDNEIKERVPRAENTVTTNLKAAKDTLISNGGVITDEVQELLDDTVGVATSLGPEGEILAETVADQAQAITTAAGVYSLIKTSNSELIEFARNNLVNQKNAEVNPRKKNVLIEALSTFDAMIEARNKQVSEDPVAFLNAEMRRDAGDQNAPDLPSDELIKRQIAMGVPPQNVRLLSNSDVQQFQKQFNALEDDYISKSEFANEFLDEKAGGKIADRDRMFRNLAEQGVLSLVDQMVIVNPGNARMFAVNAANTEDSLEAFKKTFTQTERREMRNLVRSKNTNYSGSIIGGDVGGILPRGATSNRMRHVGQMNEVVANTAMYYMLSDDSLSQEDAVEQAIETVVNTQFSFTSVNGKPIRMKKGMEGRADVVGRILERNLKDGIEELTTMVAVPQGQFGESQDVLAQKYASEIASDGYWVTTSDNSGVFLVDPDGNMVLRKRDPNEPIGDARSQFIFVSFDDISGTADDVLRIESDVSLIGSQRTKEIQNLISKRVF